MKGTTLYILATKWLKFELEKRPIFGSELCRIRLLPMLCAMMVTPCCYFIYNYNISVTNEPDYMELNKLIEKHLKTNLLHEKGSQCFVPQVDLYSQEVVDNIDLADRPTIGCRDNKVDWVDCHNSECYVTLKKQNIDDVECSYMDIIYVNDNKYYLGEPTKVFGYDKYILNRSDYVKVTCFYRNRNILGLPILSHWTGFKAGFRPIPVKQGPLKRNNGYNVMILIFESTSHNDFIRFMANSYEHLTEEMNAVILNSYSAVGEDTPANMIPILTGEAKTEQPDSREWIDNEAFIFHQAKERGYRTAYFDELHSTFSTYKKGFRDKPADHYLRPFLLEVEKFRQKAWMFENNYFFCIGAVPLHQLMLNLTQDFLGLDGKKLCVTHLSDITHESFNRIVNAEDALIQFLNTIRERRLLEDTLVIVMGDHGQRFGNFRKTFQGKLEHLFPLMAIMLPERLKRLRPEALEALQHNKDVLTTHFDLHATLMDVLDLPYTNKYMVPGSELPRGISLLRKIPKSRTCGDAGILPHGCACTHWYKLHKTDPKCNHVVNALVGYINNLLLETTDRCERRKLVSVEWVMRRSAREHMKLDPKLNKYFSYPAKLQPPTEYYQAKIVMNPGMAVFEGTMIYNIKLNYFLMVPKDVTRIDTYGPESKCIALTHPHLIKFCYCKLRK